VTVGGAGTVDDPWPLTTGLANVAAGDVLYLRGGSYAGNFTINGREGTPAQPIFVRSLPGEHAIIDGSDPALWVPNSLWHAVGDADIGLYESNDPFPHGGNKAARGSFYDRVPYTRLITNWTLADLSASNELFGPLTHEGQLPGPKAAPGEKPFPWVYLGPGLFQHPITGIVSVRLAHTTLNVPGFPDYTGPTDPNQVPLAIWTATVPVLKIINCASVHISDLTVRHGRVCVRIEKSNDIRLDHLNIYAGSYGIEFANRCTDAVVTHCLVDGGAPPWHYRSDRKTSYTYLDTDGTKKTNNLGVNTAKSLLGGTRFCSGTTIRYCELVNGHDLYLFGAGSMLQRCFISNLNDDAIFAETRGAPGVRIFENVITRSLMAINFALQGDTEGTTVDVYRNLIDLRSPTARFRPQPNPPDGFTPVVTGQLFKSNSPDSPLTLFHNTCIVADREFVTSYPHLRAYKGESARDSFNNIFVAIDSTAASRLPITLLPDPTFPARTDGNCYFRLGPFATGPLFRHPAYQFDPPPDPNPSETFDSLDELRGNPTANPPMQPSEYFLHSKELHPPGYEARSIATDPLFRSFDAGNGEPAESDDLRLHLHSPGRRHGVVLPAPLRNLDGAPSGQRPDIGCFRVGDPPLAVGVDGRLRFPGQSTT
jgi:hypothetical protein